MNIRERAVCLFKRIKDKSILPLRELAKQISIPKSSIHRHQINQKKRIAATGHDFFETEVGLEWLRRLFFAVLFIFGIQSGVGSETISLFFEILLVNAYVASSPSSIRIIKEKMREVIEKYETIYLAEIIKRCKNKELHLGGDETGFGGEMFLILMELCSGFIFTEALVKDRKYNTWYQQVNHLFKRLKKIFSLTSDGGRALIKVGKKIGCENVMDLFHLLQDVKHVFATKFHSKRRSYLSKLKELKKEEDLPTCVSTAEKSQAIATIYTELSSLDKGQQEYRNALFLVSTQTHPFENISEIKNSGKLKKELQQQLVVLREIAKTCKISDKQQLLNRFERRIEASSGLNDLWHQWIEQSVLCKTKDTEIINWVKHRLLPYIYWQEQVRKSSRKKRLKIYYQSLVAQAKAQLDAHRLTQDYLTADWISWAKAMVIKYQRTTSAIEGRNARLSHHYFSARGVRSSHIHSLTALHNFWITRDDGSTAAERLCGFKSPDLFEWVLKNMGELPLPRQRDAKKVSSINQLVPLLS